MSFQFVLGGTLCQSHGPGELPVGLLAAKLLAPPGAVAKGELAHVANKRYRTAHCCIDSEGVDTIGTGAHADQRHPYRTRTKDYLPGSPSQPLPGLRVSGSCGCPRQPLRRAGNDGGHQSTSGTPVCDGKSISAHTDVPSPRGSFICHRSASAPTSLNRGFLADSEELAVDWPNSWTASETSMRRPLPILRYRVSISAPGRAIPWRAESVKSSERTRTAESSILERPQPPSALRSSRRARPTQRGWRLQRSTTALLLSQPTPSSGW